MDISKGGHRAANGKVYPNQKQRRLLRKLIADKREHCKKTGISPIRYKLADFRKWAPALNKLGPPIRSGIRWKNCWFNHKKQRNFFQFYYQKVKEDYQKEKDVCEEKLPKKRTVCKKMQIRKFIELLKERREESEARGEPIATITSEDFAKWTKILNKLGPVYPVEKWKMTWKTMKKQKKYNAYFTPEDFNHYREIGCGSSEEFYLSDDESCEDPIASNDEEVNKSWRKRRRKSAESDNGDPVTGEELEQNYTNLCRICLKQRRTMTSFVDGSYKNISYLDIYHECIGEAFKIYNFCSTDICDLCEKNFLNMYIFRGLCLQADTKLSFIENQKEESLDSQASGSEGSHDDEENRPLSEINLHADHVDSEMDVLDEKSISEDIEETPEKTDVAPVDQQNVFHDVKLIFPECSNISVKSEDITSEIPDVANPISLDPIQCKEESQKDVETDSDKGFIPSCDDSTDEDEEKVRNVRKRRKEPLKMDCERIIEIPKTLKTPKTQKERPNKAQIELLRKLVVEKKENNKKFGVRIFRLKTNDFKRWAPKLNALGPPERPANKWKDCWFVHNKKKKSFYDFMIRGSKNLQVYATGSSKNIHRAIDSKTRKRMTRKQLSVFKMFLEERKKKAESAGQKISLYTKDFRDLKVILNSHGPPFRTVNEWKLTWRFAKKNSLKVFAGDVKEIGYDSSDAYYFTNESSEDEELISGSSAQVCSINDEVSGSSDSRVE